MPVIFIFLMIDRPQDFVVGPIYLIDLIRECINTVAL